MEITKKIKEGEELEKKIEGNLDDQLRRMKASLGNQIAAMEIIKDLEKEHNADSRKVIKEIHALKEDIIDSFKLVYRDYKLFRRPENYEKALKLHFEKFEYPHTFNDQLAQIENLFKEIERLEPTLVRETKELRSESIDLERDVKTQKPEEAKKVLKEMKELLESSIKMHETVLRVFGESIAETKKLEAGSEKVEHELEKAE